MGSFSSSHLVILLVMVAAVAFVIWLIIWLVNKSSNKDDATSIKPQPKNTDLADLGKLAELKQKGVITEEEFATKRKQLLGS